MSNGGIRREDVQCISFTENIHPIHKAWMDEASSRKIITYIPKKLEWVRRYPLLSQIIAIFTGLFLPSAKIYFIEAAAAASCLFLRRGTVICINSDTFFYNMNNSLLTRLYSKLLLKRIDGYISTSIMMQEKAKKVRKKSVVVYPFIDPANMSLFSIRPSFDNDTICIIAGARHIKGIDIVLDSFKKYKETHKHANLYVLGMDDPDIHDPWRKKVEQAGGIAPGHVSIPQYLKKSSIYVNPARHDSFGVNIIEAMAAGIPPIISEFCGAKELVEKVDKKLIAPLDANALVERMEWIKKDRKRYYRYSKKCKELARPFTKQKSIEQFKKGFLQLVESVR